MPPKTEKPGRDKDLIPLPHLYTELEEVIGRLTSLVGRDNLVSELEGWLTEALEGFHTAANIHDRAEVDSIRAHSIQRALYYSDRVGRIASLLAKRSGRHDSRYYLETARDAYVNSGIYSLMAGRDDHANRSFLDAISHSQQLAEKHPETAANYLVDAVDYLQQSLEYGSPDSKTHLENLKRAGALSKKIANQKNDPIWHDHANLLKAYMRRYARD